MIKVRMLAPDGRSMLRDELHTLYATDIRMEIVTDRPGLQLYSGNGVDNVPGKEGAVYVRRSGVCLEPQCLPDAVHFPHFPSPVLKKGDVFQSITTYRFL